MLKDGRLDFEQASVHEKGAGIAARPEPVAVVKS
jgi:hypothetical protein